MKLIVIRETAPPGYEWTIELSGKAICRPVSAQFLDIDLIAMFELVLEDGEIKVREEKHYHLVSNEKISGEDLRQYRINCE